MRPSVSPRRKTRHVGLAPVLIILSFVMIGLAGCGREESPGPYAGLFPDPDNIENLAGAGAIAEYRDETLYDFLNGGAELYFDYDIVAVASREYTLPDDSGIEASVYDMGEPGDAFGIYSIFRYAGADRVGVGNEALKTPSTIGFWKGKYYCKLLAFGGFEGAEAAMEELAKAIADRIAEAGTPPGLLDLLPEEARIPGSEKYFRRHLALNNIRYVDSENVFNLGNDTEGVTAEYAAGETQYLGYIIRYSDPGDAEAAFHSYTTYTSAKAEEASRNGIKMFILESGDTEAIALESRYIAGIWDVEAGRHPGFIAGVLASLTSED